MNDLSPEVSAAVVRTTLSAATSDALSIWNLSGDRSPRSQEYMSTKMTGSVLATGATHISRSCSLTSAMGLLVTTYRHLRQALNDSLISSCHRLDLPHTGGPITATLKPDEPGL